jgi:hypothetical protein
MRKTRIHSENTLSVPQSRQISCCQCVTYEWSQNRNITWFLGDIRMWALMAHSLLALFQSPCPMCVAERIHCNSQCIQSVSRSRDAWRSVSWQSQHDMRSYTGSLRTFLVAMTFFPASPANFTQINHEFATFPMVPIFKRLIRSLRYALGTCVPRSFWRSDDRPLIHEDAD